MKLSNHALAQIVAVAVWMVVSISAPHAGGESDDRWQGIEQKMFDRLKGCIFTVNAYTPIDSTMESTAGNHARWNRYVGTALPIDDEGHLITIACVLKDADKITVITSEGETIDARVIGSDFSGLISVLKIDQSYVEEVPPSAPLATVETGSFAFFLGVVPGMEIALSRGWISSMRSSDGLIEVTGPGNAGTSGTPVINDRSDIIGILAYNVDTDDVQPGLSRYVVLPYDYAYMIARNIINVSRSNTGWLGVGIELMGSGAGVTVQQVVNASPADHAHIIPGDRIIEFQGTAVTTPRVFIDLLSKTTPEDTISLKLIRDSSSVTLSVSLDIHPGHLPD